MVAMLPRVDDLLAAPVGVALLDRLELAGDHRLNPAGSRQAFRFNPSEYAMVVID